MIAILGLIVSALQALVLPVTIYLLVVQTRAMHIQTTALVEQSKEMPPLPRPLLGGVNGPLTVGGNERQTGTDGPAPQVARVLRAVVEDSEEEK